VGFTNIACEGRNICQDLPRSVHMGPRAGWAAVFDRVADDYDTVGVDFFKPIAAGLVQALRVGPGERVVDIGCGRGAALGPLATATAPDGSVVGLDISPRMIKLAGAEAAAAGLEVDLRVGDATAPDVPQAAFDVVLSCLVLFFLPDPLEALRRWRELLVDGGRVGVATFGPISDQWRTGVDSVLAEHLPPDMLDARKSRAAGPFGSDHGMEELLADAGYREIRTTTANVSPRFDDPEHWYRWSMSVGTRRFWEAVPEHDLARVRGAVLEAVDRCRDALGRIGFDQQVRYTIGRR
jgi:ubiquinone/menaquinone biosynthesis C-methylase UbiE